MEIELYGIPDICKWNEIEISKLQEIKDEIQGILDILLNGDYKLAQSELSDYVLDHCFEETNKNNYKLKEYSAISFKDYSTWIMYHAELAAATNEYLEAVFVIASLISSIDKHIDAYRSLSRAMKLADDDDVLQIINISTKFAEDKLKHKSGRSETIENGPEDQRRNKMENFKYIKN